MQINTDKSNDSITENTPKIPANIQLFWCNILEYIITKMINNRFYSIRIKNSKNYELRDISKSTIIIANHSCWWDGLIAYYISKKVFKTNIHMMIEDLHRCPLLAKAGGFSVEKKTPFSALKSLNYATKILRNPDNSLWIYPQGKVLPADYRPIKLKSGVSYLCQRLRDVNIVPIAINYSFLRQDRPEILAEIGKPITIHNQNIERKGFNHFLENEFEGLLDKQKNELKNGNTGEYQIFHIGKMHILRRIETHLKKFIK